ncbi:hypothetical protein G4X40_10745 [Rhodococcus sp. D2-41]|nr:hypothetical protein [Rhodococcus sp. D2-41]
MRSDREEIPEGFTKADADKAETMEARLQTSTTRAGVSPLVAPGCQAYWPAPYEVCGAIKDKYNSLGGPNSFLKYPISAELTNPGNTGKRSEFMVGPIYWSAATGAHPIVNSFMTKWGSLGWEGGYLRYPTTDEIVNPDGVGRRQEFQGGAIYWHPVSTVNGAAIGGAIRDKWNTVQAERPGSLLGYPTSDETVLPDGQGRMNRFERGVIYWSPATGAHPVAEPVLGQWASAGYEASGFGYPIEGAMAEPGSSVRQKFQNGSIYTPGTHVPVGGGLSLTYGVPTNNVLQAGALPDGISYTGPGYRLTLRVGPYATLSLAELEIQNSQAPTEFRLVFGLPGGFSLNRAERSVEIRNSTGGVVGDIQNPVAFDANLNGVQPQISVSGNQVTYRFGQAVALPVNAVHLVASDSNKQYNPYYRIGAQVSLRCSLESFDCSRSVRAWFDSKKHSEIHYPDRLDSNGTAIYYNDRLDADRHCMWQAMTTEASNAAFAQRLGDAHEEDGEHTDPPQSPGAMEMDQYNNITGRAVGLRHEKDVTGIIVECNSYADSVRIATPDQFGTNTAENDLVALSGP